MGSVLDTTRRWVSCLSLELSALTSAIAPHSCMLCPGLQAGAMPRFKIVWLGGEGKPHKIGDLMLAHGDDVKGAGEDVVRRLWPQIHSDHPVLSGFSLWDLQSGEAGAPRVEEAAQISSVRRVHERAPISGNGMDGHDGTPNRFAQAGHHRL